MPKRSAATMGDVAAKAAKTAVERGKETKFFDLYTDGTLTITKTLADPHIPAAWTNPCLTAVTKGDGANQRIGVSFVPKHLSIRGTLHFMPGTVSSPQTDFSPVVRLMVVEDRMPGSTMAVWSAMMKNYPTTSNDQAYGMIQDWDARKRFKILADRVITFNASDFGIYSSATAGEFRRTSAEKYFNFEISGSELSTCVVRDSTLTTAGAYGMMWRPVYLAAFSYATSTSTVGLTAVSRLTFKDK